MREKGVLRKSELSKREVEAQGGQEKDVNSVHDECHVSNRHMTWWHNAWWIRVDNGPHNAQRQGTAQNLASSQASGRTGPRRKLGRRDPGGRKRETEKGRKGEAGQNRKTNEATLHLIFHVSQQQQQQPQQLQ